MAVRSRRPGTAGAVDLDLRRLHAGWMERVFPSQRAGVDPVLGNWTPSTTSERVAYHGWACLGVFVVAFLYPLVACGFALRRSARRIDRAAATLGLAGIVGLSAAVWGGLTAVTYVQFSQRGAIVVAVAAVVATLAAVAAVTFSDVVGRAMTVLFVYPAATVAILLPTAVAAVVAPFPAAIGSVGLGPTDPAVRVLAAANALGPFRVGSFEAASVAAWLGTVVLLGWASGCAVDLADLVRPSRSRRT